MDIKEIIRKAYRARELGDWPAWLELFSDDILYEQPGLVLEGKDALKNALERGVEGFSSQSYRPLDIIFDGEQAMYIEQIEVVTGSGDRISMKGGVHLRLKDGKISYLASYHDTVPFTKALQGREVLE